MKRFTLSKTWLICSLFLFLCHYYNTYVTSLYEDELEEALYHEPFSGSILDIVVFPSTPVNSIIAYSNQNVLTSYPIVDLHNTKNEQYQRPFSKSLHIMNNTNSININEAIHIPKYNWNHVFPKNEQIYAIYQSSHNITQFNLNSDKNKVINHPAMKTNPSNPTNLTNSTNTLSADIGDIFNNELATVTTIHLVDNTFLHIREWSAVSGILLDQSALYISQGQCSGRTRIRGSINCLEQIQKHINSPDFIKSLSTNAKYVTISTSKLSDVSADNTLDGVVIISLPGGILVSDILSPTRSTFFRHNYSLLLTSSFRHSTEDEIRYLMLRKSNKISTNYISRDALVEKLRNDIDYTDNTDSADTNDFEYISDLLYSPKETEEVDNTLNTAHNTKNGCRNVNHFNHDSDSDSDSDSDFQSSIPSFANVTSCYWFKGSTSSTVYYLTQDVFEMISLYSHTTTTALSTTTTQSTTTTNIHRLWISPESYATSIHSGIIPYHREKKHATKAKEQTQAQVQGETYSNIQFSSLHNSKFKAKSSSTDSILPSALAILVNKEGLVTAIETTHAKLAWITSLTSVSKLYPSVNSSDMKLHHLKWRVHHQSQSKHTNILVTLTKSAKSTQKSHHDNNINSQTEIFLLDPQNGMILPAITPNGTRPYSHDDTNNHNYSITIHNFVSFLHIPCAIPPSKLSTADTSKKSAFLILRSVDDAPIVEIYFSNTNINTDTSTNSSNIDVTSLLGQYTKCIETHAKKDRPFQFLFSSYLTSKLSIISVTPFVSSYRIMSIIPSSTDTNTHSTKNTKNTIELQRVFHKTFPSALSIVALTSTAQTLGIPRSSVRNIGDHEAWLVKDYHPTAISFALVESTTLTKQSTPRKSDHQGMVIVSIDGLTGTIIDSITIPHATTHSATHHSDSNSGCGSSCDTGSDSDSDNDNDITPKILHFENVLVVIYHNSNTNQYELLVREAHTNVISSIPYIDENSPQAIENKNNANNNSTIPIKTINFTPTAVFTLPGAVSTLALSKTVYNIATREIYIATKQYPTILTLSRSFVDARRPINQTRSDSIEGLIPYLPHLEPPAPFSLTLNERVEDVRAIYTSESHRESTTIVTTIGLGIFQRKQCPNGKFDSLSDEFGYPMIIMTCILLTMIMFYLQYYVQRNKINNDWI